MPSIVLTDEQARVLSQAREAVELRDRQGQLLARLPIAAGDEIAEAQRRLASGQRRWSSEKVQSFLARLEEMQAKEGMDEAKVREALERFRAGDPA